MEWIMTFPSYWGQSQLTKSIILQRGRYTTNQMNIVQHNNGIFASKISAMLVGFQSLSLGLRAADETT